MELPIRINHTKKYILHTGESQVRLHDLISISLEKKIDINHILHSGRPPKKVFGYLKDKPRTYRSLATEQNRTNNSFVGASLDRRLSDLPEISLNKLSRCQVVAVCSPYEEAWTHKILREQHNVRVSQVNRHSWALRRINWVYTTRYLNLNNNIKCHFHMQKCLKSWSTLTEEKKRPLMPLSRLMKIYWNESLH